jgi:hypothetical protein
VSSDRHARRTAGWSSSSDALPPGPLVEARSIGRARISVTPTSWSPRRALDLVEWSEQGRRFGLMGRGTGWWIGDWVNYGNAVYGEKYSRAARLTGYDVQTLMNMAWIASCFTISRRRETLSWSHHAEVASLPAPDRERWLDRAEQDRLSVRSLRDEVARTRAAEARNARSEPPKGFDVHCPECGSCFRAKPPGRGGARTQAAR